jgi:hypothetical protein
MMLRNPLLGDANIPAETVSIREWTVLSTRSVPRSYLEDNWGEQVSQLSVVGQFCVGGFEDRTWGREAEESPLLEAGARERLMKIQQAGKGLAGAVVICEMWRLAVAL